MYDLLDSSSSSSARDSEDQLDVLLLELATSPSPELGPHINLDGLSEINCRLLFRYINRYRIVLDKLVIYNSFNHSHVSFLFISRTNCQLVPFTDLKRSIFHRSRALYNYEVIT